MVENIEMLLGASCPHIMSNVSSTFISLSAREECNLRGKILFMHVHIVNGDPEFLPRGGYSTTYWSETDGMNQILVSIQGCNISSFPLKQKLAVKSSDTPRYLDSVRRVKFCKGFRESALPQGFLQP